MKTIVWVAALWIGAGAAAHAGNGSGDGSAGAAKPQRVTGEKARELTRALKFAGVKPIRAREHWTYRVAAIDCHSMSETEDMLGSYDCQLDRAKAVDAAAEDLQGALLAVGLAEDGGAGQRHVRAYAVTCEVDAAATGGVDKLHRCTFSAEAPATK
jgi:hypothetical protein